MDKRKKSKKAGMVVATISLSIIILVVMFATGLLEFGLAKPDLLEDDLVLDAKNLLKTGETNDTINVTCNLYVTNIGEKSSGSIKVIAYVIDTSNNLATHKNSTEIEEVSSDTTEEIEIDLVLSSMNSRVDIMVFEDGKLIIQGNINLKIQPVYYTHPEYGDKVSHNVETLSCDFERIR